jgi:hypothetical protein
MGYRHAVADARVPFLGATALLILGGLCFAAGGWVTRAGRLALVALAGLLAPLAAYVCVTQPVNQRQTA